MVKITFISDTHTKHKKLNDDLPGGDIIVHAGDISNIGHKYDIDNFLEWFSELPYTHKIFIAGNHDFYFEKNDFVLSERLASKGVIYLQDGSVIINGIKFYGSPWQPEFYNWAFNLTSDELYEKWQLIDIDTDILITHGPPHLILDKTPDYMNVGCKHLLDKVLAIKPKIHVFGHIHWSYGMQEFHDVNFINASVLDESYTYNRQKPITVLLDDEKNILTYGIGVEDIS